MSEWLHGWGNGEGVSDLVDCSEPRSDIRNVARSRKIEDVVHELCGWFDTCVGDQESKEVDFGLSKLELLRIEGAAAPGSLFQVGTDTEEVLFDTPGTVVIPKDGVVYTSLGVVDISCDLGSSLGVPISS